MFALIIVLFGFQAFAQTTYFLGKRTDSVIDDKLEIPLAGTITVNKTSRTWSFVRCTPPQSVNCRSYNYRLFKGKDEKYYLERPISLQQFIVNPVKVEDDHIKLRNFTLTHKTSDGSVFHMEHLTLGENAMWKAFYKNSKGEILEMKTIFEKARKEAYDNFIKGKKVEPLQLTELKY